MFKIESLTLYSMDDQEYTYSFKRGINYFKGKNSSGKTEFYLFLDFMFGSSEKIKEKTWYKDSLKMASIIFQYNNLTYHISRTQDSEVNYFRYSDDKIEEPVNLRTYKERLNLIFAQNEKVLKKLWDFTEEDLTYRTFTMFNFLGEKRQGSTQDFLDKCSEVKYSIKLLPILNYIFNNNLEEIYNLQIELAHLNNEVKDLEKEQAKHNFICQQVNQQLKKVGAKVWYTGKNADIIQEYIINFKKMISQKTNVKTKTISELEVMYSNISEQIKVYENKIFDTKRLKTSNYNRKILLEKLENLVQENNNFDYLVSPIKKIMSELDSTISFSKYIINDNTIHELKNQEDILRTEIKRNDARFTLFELEDKAKAIALIEEYIMFELETQDEKLKANKIRIREIKERLKQLQNSDNASKIKAISKNMTRLYVSARENSSLVEEDSQQNGFELTYKKKGNILQLTVLESIMNKDTGFETKRIDYHMGSMARHTLIQLCGYLAFLNILLPENKYPLIPILVIDHISKPFDLDNSKAIGKVLCTGLEDIKKTNLQIFMFDDKDPSTLNINPDHFENLVDNRKTGFNPFFDPQS